MSTLVPLLRILFGLLFIASAVLKLFPIDYFELILVQQVGLTWSLVPFFARGLIWFEFALGAAIALNYRPRLSIQLSLGMLVFFSAYLIMQIFLGNAEEDCGCFGELLPMDANSSLIKNGVFILLGVFLLFKSEAMDRWKVKYAAPALIILSLPALLIAHPIPTTDPDVEFGLNFELLNKEPFDSEISLDQGRKVVVIMYANCWHCEKLAALISTLDPKEVKDELRIIVMGGPERVEQFVELTGIGGFEFRGSSDRNIVAAIDGTFPALAFVKDGVVESKWTGGEINLILLSKLLNE